VPRLNNSPKGNFMTKARLLRRHGGIAPNPEDYRAIHSMTGWKGGEKHNSKHAVKAAKKSARHMAAETRYQGGSRIIMASSALAQPASDYTRQISPRDGACYQASTGKTLLRKCVK
jgi:hypothetical protein